MGLHPPVDTYLEISELSTFLSGLERPVFATIFLHGNRHDPNPIGPI